MLPSPLATGGHPGRRSSGLWLEVRETRLVLGDGLTARARVPHRHVAVRDAFGVVSVAAHRAFPGGGAVPSPPAPQREVEAKPGVPGAEPVGRFKMCLLRSWPRGLLVQYPSVRLSFFLSA